MGSGGVLSKEACARWSGRLSAGQPSGLAGEGKRWRIGMEVYGDRDILPRDVISRKLSVPNAERIFFIRHALRANPVLVTRIPTGIPSHSPRLPRNAATLGQHPRNSSTATR